jgi:hypothetical protein
LLFFERFIRLGDAVLAWMGCRRGSPVWGRQREVAMEFSSDIRWLQLFEGFQRDLLALERGVMLAQAIATDSAPGCRCGGWPRLMRI